MPHETVEEDLGRVVLGTTVPNGIGRLVRAEEGSGGANGFDEFEYDGAGSPSLHRRTMDGVEFGFTRTFGPLGRVLTTTYPDGEEVTWHYDRRLLHRISSSGGSYAGDYLADVQYDAFDRPVMVELGGTSGAAVVDETRTFDPVTEQLDRIDAFASGTTLASGEYTTDAFGRIRNVVAQTRPVGGGALKTHGLPAHQYDGLDRLIQGTEYDALGNLLRKDNVGSVGWSQLAYEDPARPHALTSATPQDPHTASSVAYFYDAAGNVETKTRSGGLTGSATVNMTYDAAGLPKSVGPSNGLTTTFTYSALGQRVKTARPDESVLSPEPGFEYLPGQTLVNKHFFLGERRIASSASVWSAPAAGASAGWAIRMPDLPTPGPWLLFGIYGTAILGGGLWVGRRRLGEVAVPFRRRAAVATVALCAPTLVASPCALPPAQTTLLGAHTAPVFFYVTDHLGSTILAVDQSGVVRTRELYLPFGDRTGVSGGQRLRHRFTGAELVEGTTLYILGVRLYDSETGRFLQPDPLSDPRDPQRLNRYTYARNSPLLFTDLTGLEHTSPSPERSTDAGREGANQSLYRYLTDQQERAYVASVLATLQGFADALRSLGGLGGGVPVGESAPATFDTSASQSGVQVADASGGVTCYDFGCAQQLPDGRIIDPRHPLAQSTIAAQNRSGGSDAFDETGRQVFVGAAGAQAAAAAPLAEAAAGAALTRSLVGQRLGEVAFGFSEVFDSTNGPSAPALPRAGSRFQQLGRGLGHTANLAGPVTAFVRGLFE